MDSIKFEAQIARTGSIDLEAGTIKGVSLISTPEAKGHGMGIDQKSIESFQAATEGKMIKAYYTHNDNEAFDTIGLWQNFEIIADGEETKLTGDFEALDSWKENRKEEFDALFELAEKAPEAFGVSAEFTGSKVFYSEEEEIEYSGQEEAGKLFARASEVQAFSIVATPAANPTGLFSEKSEAPKEESIAETLSVISEENTELKSEIKTAKIQLEVLEKDIEAKDSQILEQAANLEKAEKETEAWQIKYAQMADMGTDPVQQSEAQAPKTFAEQLSECSTAAEKLELFKSNQDQLMKEWSSFQ
tara:strand:+ start:2038 stop:2946 length:909 start_codon:yes stop_codon:yes gene_type:complete